MSDVVAARAPLLVIRASKGWAALQVRELWMFRDLLFSLAGRDVKLRYRQTALGVAWVVFQPLMTAAIFSVVFGVVGKFKSEGVPYFLFAYVGQMAWNAFSGTLTKSSTCLVLNAQLISKVFFPRLVLPLSTVISTLIDFGVALAMLVVLMALYHVTPGAAMVTLPFWLMLMLLLGLGVGLIAAALMVTYRDVQYVLPVAVQMLMYASPVPYSLSNVPAKWAMVFRLNPLSGILEGFRWATFDTSAPNWAAVAYSAVVVAGVFAWGLYMFKRMERRFADVI